MKLTEPYDHVRCGYEVTSISTLHTQTGHLLQSYSLNSLNDIEVRMKDLMLYHNQATWERGTCGSISWQVKLRVTCVTSFINPLHIKITHPDNSPYLVGTNTTLRLGLTWNVPWGCRKGWSL